MTRKNITGSTKLFDALKNEDWRRQIGDNLKKKTGAGNYRAKDGEILGFTGPLATMPSGRAFLAGLGVHEGAKTGTGQSAVLHALRGIEK